MGPRKIENTNISRKCFLDHTICPPITRGLKQGTVTFRGWKSLCCGGSPVRHRGSSSIPGLYSLEAASTARPAVTIKNVSGRCQMSPGRPDLSSWRSTAVVGSRAFVLDTAPHSLLFTSCGNLQLFHPCGPQFPFWNMCVITALSPKVVVR